MRNRNGLSGCPLACREEMVAQLTQIQTERNYALQHRDEIAAQLSSADKAR